MRGCCWGLVMAVVLLVVAVVGSSEEPDSEDRESKLVWECYFTEECVAEFQDLYVKCLGRYCGRNVKTYPPADSMNESAQIYDLCEKCYAATFSDGWVCNPCEEWIDLYGWIFLMFLVFYVWFNGILQIYAELKDEKMYIRLIVYSVQTIETVIAITMSFVGSWIYQCPITHLRDWYPVFYNPPNQECTSETMFPFYTTMYKFFTYSLMLLFLRLCIQLAFLRKKKKLFLPLMSQMYYIPFCSFSYLFVGGLLYYGYPYIGVVVYGFQMLIMAFEKELHWFDVIVAVLFRSLNLSVCFFAMFIFFLPDLWWMIFPCLVVGLIVSPVFVLLLRICIIKCNMKDKVKAGIKGLLDYFSR